MNDAREQRSSILRRFALLGLLAAVAFISAFFFIRSFLETAPEIGPPAPVAPAASDATRHASFDTRERPGALPPNPALQKAGPPDPEAQRTAAVSAEQAAKAAAALAATQ
jgi:hypothetical protein